ncbi:histidinol-phosphatase HisJ family protein [Sporomusa sp.]|uniref:histidinol-phosphatase HisJ family protein n=1 Tax=Sporomusa sp. TaxID=2078658 RepID=UPI002BBCFD5C|nr:histidinol-phosphatase HisJ family protein [Sporomusa sp.]HWR44723.1 histidinol-phosphatase HisJ family protein [Sporomusa sp.]
MSLLADSHVHTILSADAKDEMFDMCKTAIDKGLSYICFTEHVDYNQFDPGCRYFDYDKYSDAIERTREKFGDKIHVLSGIEFGEPHVYQKQFEKIIKKEFDVVMVGIHYIGKDKVGLHWINGTNEYSKSLLKDYTNERIFHEYYEELLQVVKLGGFDVLAHFDNPKRYLKESGHEEELIGEIVHEIVNAGIAIEINTSPLRRGYHECAPDSEIVKQYLDVGGSRITIGSDVHSCSEVAANFDYAVKLVKDHKATLGVFKNRCFVTI